MMEGDLPRAALFLAPLHPNADQTQVLEMQIYNAILERRPAPIIARLKEVLAQPDPALGYLNGELRFCLGWAQEVAGDHAAAQETWRQARSELEGFLKDQPDNYSLMDDLALTDMDWVTKSPLSPSPNAPSRKIRSRRTRTSVPDQSKFSPGWRRRQESRTAPSRSYKNCSQNHTVPDSEFRCRSHPRCSGSIRCSIRFAMIRASRNSAKRNRVKIDNFFAELKRRNVYKVAVAYAVVGWLLVQMATQVFPFLRHSELGSCGW